MILNNEICQRDLLVVAMIKVFVMLFFYNLVKRNHLISYESLNDVFIIPILDKKNSRLVSQKESLNFKEY